MTTALTGIGLFAAGVALRYSANLSAGAAWLWNKLPPIPAWPKSTTTKTATLPTAAEAFAALSLIQTFRKNCADDPSYGLIIAALGEVNK